MLYDATNAIKSVVNSDSRAVFSDVSFDSKAAGKALGFDVSAVNPKTLEMLHNRGTFDMEAGRVTLAEGPLGIGGDSTTLAKANAVPDNSPAAVAARQAAAFRLSLQMASSERGLTRAEVEANNARNTMPQGIVNTPKAPYVPGKPYDTGTNPGVVNLPRGVFSGGHWT
jgi:hypothetical protein